MYSVLMVLTVGPSVAAACSCARDRHSLVLGGSEIPANAKGLFLSLTRFDTILLRRGRENFDSICLPGVPGDEAFQSCLRNRGSWDRCAQEQATHPASDCYQRFIESEDLSHIFEVRDELGQVPVSLTGHPGLGLAQIQFRRPLAPGGLLSVRAAEGSRMALEAKSFRIIEVAPVPTHLGAMSKIESGVYARPFSAAGSCSVPWAVAGWRLGLAVDAHAEPWRDLGVILTRVDGEPFERPRESLCEMGTLAAVFRWQPDELIFVGRESPIEPGKRTIALELVLPGFGGGPKTELDLQMPREPEAQVSEFAVKTKRIGDAAFDVEPTAAATKSNDAALGRDKDNGVVSRWPVVGALLLVLIGLGGGLWIRRKARSDKR